MSDAELDEDGLPRSIVGEWALEKHERLQKYVDITRPTRRKYTVRSPSRRYLGGSAYIDLFCGYGRSRIRNTKRIIDGSPVVAIKSALAGSVPYSEIHLADTNGLVCDAAIKRLEAIGAHATRDFSGGRCTRDCFKIERQRFALRFYRSVQFGRSYLRDHKVVV